MPLFLWSQMLAAERVLVEDADRSAHFCMKATQRFSAASPAGDDHQA
jgi:hypothetical protein